MRLCEPAQARRDHCRVSGDETLRVAACFFGLVRALDHSISSIYANLLAPLHAAADGAVDVFVHTLLVAAIGDEHAKGKALLRKGRYAAHKHEKRLELLIHP